MAKKSYDECSLIYQAWINEMVLSLKISEYCFINSIIFLLALLTKFNLSS